MIALYITLYFIGTIVAGWIESILFEEVTPRILLSWVSIIIMLLILFVNGVDNIFTYFKNKRNKEKWSKKSEKRIKEGKEYEENLIAHLKKYNGYNSKLYEK